MIWDMQSNKIDALVKGPSDSPYEGGIFRFEIILPFEYPLKPPVFKLKTRIYHPDV